MKRILIVIALVLMSTVLTNTTARAASIVQVSMYTKTPTAVYITWTESSDSCFSSYTLQRAPGQDGPWTTVPITSPHSGKTATTSTVSGLTPGQTHWYRVIDTDCSSATAYSNPISVTQPNAAFLTLTRPSAGSASLSWTNSATYGSGFYGASFSSYVIYENSTSLGSITNLNTRTYTVQGLSPNATYHFHVTTLDTYSEGYVCPTYCQTVSSTSNEVQVAPLNGADFTSTVVGLKASFTASARDGLSPYSYDWDFGDGSTGIGSTVSHTYGTSGNHSVILTVTDSAGRTAKASHMIQLTATTPPPPTGTQPPSASALDARVLIAISLVIVAAVVVAAVVIPKLRNRREKGPPRAI